MQINFSEGFFFDMVEHLHDTQHYAIFFDRCDHHRLGAITGGIVKVGVKTEIRMDALQRFLIIDVINA
nr:hypothetical protein [Candidatus Reidiella endopervernicosa]